MRFAAWAFLPALAFALAQTAAVAHASEPRTALVIGAAAYRSPDVPLKQPVNDARAIASVLRALGFEVILREDPDRATFLRALSEFGSRLSQSRGIGLFYFAGHGVQVSGRNYLLPVDAGLRSERDAAVRAIDVDEVVQRLRDANARINVVVLDACRDNPLLRDSRSAGGEGASPGFAPMRPPQGTLIAYATEPGRVAADGRDGNSPYTRALLRHLGTPGLAVEQVFKRVREEVSRETGGRQVPVEYSMLTGSDLVLVPAPAVERPAVVASAAQSAPKEATPPRPAIPPITLPSPRDKGPRTEDSTKVARWIEDEREIQSRAAGLGVDELRDLEQAARKGEPKSQVTFGLVHHQGRIVTRSNKVALQWFQRAADQGYPVAENLVGWMYMNGQGAAADLQKAESYFRRAAERGLPSARENLLLVTARRRPDDPQAIIDSLRHLLPAPASPPSR